MKLANDTSFNYSFLINHLRKNGDLDQSYIKVKELFAAKVVDDFNEHEQLAAFWTLDRVITQAKNETHLEEAKQFLNLLPVINSLQERKSHLMQQVIKNNQRLNHSEELIGCEKVTNVGADSYFEWESLNAYIEELAQSKNLQRIDIFFPRYLELTYKYLTFNNVATDFAWNLNRYGKLLLEVERPDFPDYLRVKRLLNYFIKLCQNASDLSRLAVLNLATELIGPNEWRRVDFNFAKFFQLWDPSQLPAFSWESEIFNERRKRPNAVKFYELAADEAVRMNDVEMCEFYLPKLFFAIKKSPLDKPSLLYRVAKIYRSLERFPEELDCMIQVVQLNSTVWTWNALGEAFNRNNPSKAIICWCKGYSFPGKGLLKLAIMKNVLSYCLEHKEIKVAQMLAEEIETVFSNNKWTLKGDLAANISRAKALAPKGMTPQSFIESHARKADKLITPIPKN